MATIRDVAKLAGVSVATVSHVLNNTRTVLPETRQLVLDAIERLNYRPNAVARSLATNQTFTVGVLVADITNPFFSAMVRGIEERLSARNYNLIVCNTDERGDKEARYLEVLLDRRIDGLLVATTGTPQPIFEEFNRLQIPLVFIDRQPPLAWGPLIAVDNEFAGYLATKHLIDHGHRRIAIIARNPSLSTVRGRVGGYRKALEVHGLPVQDTLIRTVPPTLEAAYNSSCALLDDGEPPTAVVAANHIMALGILRAIQAKALSCPADISLICFDDHPWAPLFGPPLTVIKQPVAELCDAAVGTLLRAIQAKRRVKDGNGASDHPLPDVILTPELVERASCAAPAGT